MRSFSWWIVVAFACASFDIAARGDELPVISIWPGQAPGETGDVGPEVAQPNKLGELPPVIRLTNISQPTLTVMVAPKEQRNGTAVVICPGGGFNILAWQSRGRMVAERPRQRAA